MCGLWRATWAATWAATVTYPRCGVPRSTRSSPRIWSRSTSWRAPAHATANEAEDIADFSAIDSLLVDTGAALESLPQVGVTDDAAHRIRLGNPVIIRGRDAPIDAEEACATARGRLVAIGSIEAGMFKPKRVFAG